MREQNLQLVRQKCIEANPEARWYMSTLHGPGLADVLLTTEGEWVSFYSASIYGIKKTGRSEGAVLYAIVQKWNLRQDDLTAQSDECIEFLAQLLK